MTMIILKAKRDDYKKKKKMYDVKFKMVILRISGVRHMQKETCKEKETSLINIKMGKL
jgi:hypothetical protein